MDGEASAYVAAEYGLYDFVQILLANSGGQRVLAPLLLIAAILPLIVRTRRVALLWGLLTLNMLPIVFVRGYAHYFQLVAPWAVILAAEFCYVVADSGRDKGVRNALAVVLFFISIPSLLHALGARSADTFRFGLGAQQATAAVVQGTLHSKRDTLIVGSPWLYYLADLTPPNHDLSFVPRPEDLESRLAAARNVILMPTGAKKPKILRSMILRGGFGKAGTAKDHGGDIEIFARPSLDWSPHR